MLIPLRFLHLSPDVPIVPGTRALFLLLNSLVCALLGLVFLDDLQYLRIGQAGRAKDANVDHGEPAAGGAAKLHPFAGRRKSDPPGCPRNHRMAPQPVRIAKAASKP